MEADNACEVAFDGTKFYWRTRNTVDVVIAHHKNCKKFEVIVYEPTLDKEAPRIYLDEGILMSKVDHNEIDSKLSFAKRNNVPLTEKFVGGIVNKVVSDFILNRLFIKEIVQAEKKFIVEVRIDDNEIMMQPDFGELVCSPPEALSLHQTKHFKHILESAVQEAMQALEEEKKKLHATCEAAAELSARVTPIVRDRWRMPLVLNKVLRGARLGFKDSKIFEKIKSNLKDDESVARMHAVMQAKVAPVTPPPSQRLLGGSEVSMNRRTAHLTKEVSFRQRQHNSTDGPSYRNAKTTHHGGSEANSPAHSELSMTRRSSLDDDFPVAKETGSKEGPVGGPKKASSTARFDTVSSRGKMVVEDFQPSIASTTKPVLKKKKSKASPKTPRRSSINESQSSGEEDAESGEHEDDANYTTQLGRVLSGFSSLGASIRSSFKFSRNDTVCTIDEGCERSAPSRVLRTSILVTECAGRLADSAGVPAVALVDAMQRTGGNCSVEDADLDAPVVSTKPKVKRSSFLGSFLLAMVGGRSGDATPAPPPSREGSGIASSPVGWMSSKKIVPGQ